MVSVTDPRNEMSSNSTPIVQSNNPSTNIPNIDIGKAYDQHYTDAEIHYEQLEKLADFFGRNMPVHHHDRNALHSRRHAG